MLCPHIKNLYENKKACSIASLFCMINNGDYYIFLSTCGCFLHIIILQQIRLMSNIPNQAVIQ